MRRRGYQALLILVAFFTVSSGVNAQQMSTPGKFSVGEDGSAQYAIPIQLRGNFGGIVPDVSLKYNSHAGNGMLGLGWSVSGFSAIARCAKTMAQDGVDLPVLDNKDNNLNTVFCKDGRRLNRNPTLDNLNTYLRNYSPEVEDFSIVSRNIGNASATPLATTTFLFTAKTKDALSYTYTQVRNNSSTPDIESSQSLSWPVSDITDKFGNRLSYAYTVDQPNVMTYPYTIDYIPTASGTRLPLLSIQYEDRPDIAFSYREGVKIRLIKRVTSIRTYSGDGLSRELLKEYRMGYDLDPTTQHSRLVSVTECDPTGVCLPAIRITYAATAAVKFGATFQSGVVDWGSASGREWIDFNGDGKADFCRVIGAVGAYRLACTLSVGNGFGETIVSGVIDAGVDVSRKWIDVNGDGMADFCRIVGTTGTYQLSCVLGTPAGFGNAIASAIDPGNEMANAVWSDKQSDGRMRYCRFDSSTNFKCAVLQGAGFVDVAGGGMGSGKFALVDLIGGGLIYRCGVGGAAVLPCVSLTNYPLYRSDTYYNGLGNSNNAFWTDLNGDGRGDYCSFFTTSTQTVLQCFYSKGSSSYPATNDGFGSSNIFGVDAGMAAGRKWLDVNGDGNADFCRVIGNAGTYKLACGLSTGSALGATIFSDVIDPGQDAGAGWADINGTGEQAECRLVGATNLLDSRIACTPLIVGTKGAVKFSNSLGRDITITYKPLTDSSVYTKDKDAVYPLIDILKPVYVVSVVASDDGIGGARNTTYSYGGLKADKAGRGSLGFRWTQSTLLDTGIISRTEYRQDWPYAGLPISSARILAGKGRDGLIKKSVNSYGCHGFGEIEGCPVAVNNRYFPFLKQTVNESWDVNGAILPSLTVTNELDIWGNVTRMISTSSDGFDTITENTYVNMVAPPATSGAAAPQWQIGQLVKSVVTRTIP